MLAQALPEWELLVGDDGSPDDTAAVVRPYLADARVQYLPKPNAKRGAARNSLPAILLGHQDWRVQGQRPVGAASRRHR